MTADGIRGIPLAIYAKQDVFLRAHEFIRGFVAGRGGGKTFVGALDVIMHARAGDSCMAVSPSYVVLEDTTWPTFQMVAEMLGVWIRGVKSPIPRAYFVTQDGGRAELVFRSGEKPDSLRGPSKALLWLDEASIMHPDVLKFGIPVLRYKGRMGRLTLTMTPRGRTHWTFGVFFKRIGTTFEVQAMGDDGAALLDSPQTEIYQDIVYRRADNTCLVQAHSLENPFLPEEFVDHIASQYTELLAMQELGGQFVDIEGLMFSRGWFPVIEQPPMEGMRVRYWDRAADETGLGSESSGTLMVRTPQDTFVIEDVIHGHWSPNERDNVIIQTAQKDARKYGNTVQIYHEQEGGSGGKEVASQLNRKLIGFPVYSDVVSGKRSRMVQGIRLPGQAKIVRAMPLAAQAEAGNVAIVRGEWNADFLDQMAAFPESGKADMVDSTSGSFNKLAGGIGYDWETPSSESRDVTEGSSRFGQLVRDLEKQKGQRRRF